MLQFFKFLGNVASFTILHENDNRLFFLHTVLVLHNVGVDQFFHEVYLVLNLVGLLLGYGACFEDFYHMLHFRYIVLAQVHLAEGPASDLLNLAVIFHLLILIS